MPLDPADGTLGYCCVLGMGGREFGLAVFLGDDGLAAYRSLMAEETEPESMAVLDSLRSLSATFVNREYLEARDRQTIGRLDLRFRGRNAWPLGITNITFIVED